MTVEGRAFARAGLLGNPSDGYHGKILAISVTNYAAQVVLSESGRLRLRIPAEEANDFSSVEDLLERIGTYGYYGGLRLIKAAIKRFAEFCRRQGVTLPARNFSLSYTSTIPRQLGLGGSSALITAVMRALQIFYGVDIPKPLLPTLILEAEREELGINAGFMDRVAQVYEGCMYMDLSESHFQRRGFGVYESLDPGLLPPLYLAFDPGLGKVSGRVLHPIQEGYARGDAEIRATLKELAGLAEEGKSVLMRREYDRFQVLMDKNFELRRRIMPISLPNLELVQAARECGASAKFAGSGGSIIGMYQGEEMFAALAKRLAERGAVVIKPEVV